MAIIPYNKIFWLEQSAFIPAPHETPSSRIGGLVRNKSNGYASETLAIFDLSSLAGKIVLTAQLEGTINGYDGSRTGAKNGYACTQNRVKSDTWTGRTPLLSDSDYTIDWSEKLQSAVIANAASGTTVFSTNAALVTEIQKQIDGTPHEADSGYARTWREGIIVSFPTDFYGYYNSYSSWQLNLTYTDPARAITNDYHQRRRTVI